ncbi:MAG: hypothetical protein AAF596_06110 [Planctomycetota bacterium]
MSRYIGNLGASLEKGLAGVPRAQPEQVAGYWANRDFWLAEFDHLIAVVAGHDERLRRMREAHDRRVGPGGGHNRDEFGAPCQQITDTTSKQQRKHAVRDARNALRALADRAFDLRLASREEFDDFVEHLRTAQSVL